jgi:signal peptidase II
MYEINPIQYISNISYNKTYMQFIFFILASVFIPILDITSKKWAENILQNNDIILWKDIMFTLQYNTGIAFSIPIAKELQIILSSILLIFLFFYTHTSWHWKNWLGTIGTGLVFGGALGNLYERIGDKGVTDFIQIFAWFPVFNIADISIFLGVFVLGICELRNNSHARHL